MTKTKLTLAGLLLVGLITISNAQTNTAPNPISVGFWQPIFSVTNWTFTAGYGHSVSGVGRNLAFAEGVYDFNANAGMILGGEDLWHGGGSSQFAVVKGGLTLKTDVQPFKWTGVTWLQDRILHPWGAVLISTPKGNNAVGEITVAGADFDLFKTGQFTFSVDGFYENRSGQGEWDGNYAGGFLAVSRNKYSISVGYIQPSQVQQVAEVTGPQMRFTREF